MVTVNAIAGGRGSHDTGGYCGNAGRSAAGFGAHRSVPGHIATDFRQWLRWPMLMTGEAGGYDAERSVARNPAYPH